MIRISQMQSEEMVGKKTETSSHLVEEIGLRN